MCSVTYHESVLCGHRWVTLQLACHKISTTANNTTTKAGFNTCPSLRHTDHKLRIQNVAGYVLAPSNSSNPHREGKDGDSNGDACPICTKRGVYDRNECRIVKDTEYRMDLGLGSVDRRTGDVGMLCVLL